MNDRWRPAVAAAIVLAVPLGGCHALRQAYVPLPVGTCVRVSDRAEATVPCTEPHTHIVVAVVGEGETCPPEANMFAAPADPHDGRVTTCYAPDAAAE